MTELLALARSPGRGAARILEHGRLSVAVALVIAATAVAAVNAARFIGDVPVSSILYGSTRSPAIVSLIDLLGRERTAVIGYLLEQVWTALVVVTAFSPLFVWLLGSTAVHAAARIDGARRPLRPMLILFGYATALTRIPADAAAAILGSGRSPGAPYAQLIGAACLVWLAVIVWRAIETHYSLAAAHAAAVFLIAVVLFYVVPLALIVAAGVAILIAAIALDYVPGL